MTAQKYLCYNIPEAILDRW